ncbi:vitamin K epoxide reductase family protein [Flavobacterium bizetiae]|uniref:vitamin K epoxide reductase family protein n=1 Tax=Flavobacterium bizetiae TaxID=2704140 RepID=UPI0037574514
MSKNFNFLFQYLKKEQIALDHSEFLFQIGSHTNYPSLLSITDTLNFFGIQNGALHIDVSSIELLPVRFITALNKLSNVTQFYFIEEKDDRYFCTSNDDTFTLTRSELESHWSGIVFLVEKNEISENHISKKRPFKWLLPIISFILFISILFRYEQHLENILFIIFPIIGGFLCFASFQDLIGLRIDIVNDFCSNSKNVNCSSVVNSNKWRVFKYINFSDLGVIFFISQLFSHVTFIISDNSLSFFSIQVILLILSFPVIILSIYFQKFIEKKWCLICLGIIGIILSEMIYLIIIGKADFRFINSSIILYGFIFSLVSLFWFYLKEKLLLQKKLKDLVLSNNRFVRNYDVFKKILLSEDNIALADTPVILGNKMAKTEITIITSPFCSFCKDAHHLLEKILKTKSNDLKIKVLINADIDSLDEEKQSFFRILISLYTEYGEHAFLKALNDWFENRDLKKFLEKYNFNYNEKLADSIFKLQFQWCTANQLFLTPLLFINGYRYPQEYKREDLLFFIDEIIEDDNF